MARTSAANPAALLASPAAVGKLLYETILRCCEESWGRAGSLDSRADRSARSSRRQAWVREEERDWGAELRVRVSVV